MNEWLWQGKPWQAFKTFAIIFSFTMNLVLLITLLLVAPQIIPTVDTVAEPLVSGLSDSFVDMGEATITRTIPVNDKIFIDFDLPLSTTTTVTVIEPVPLLVPATFNLPGGGGTINGTVALNLPAGLQLPVALDITVPVQQEIPVALMVDVAIPLSETGLAAPFGTLEGLFMPLDGFIRGLPSSNDELFDRVLTDQPEAQETTTEASPDDE